MSNRSNANSTALSDDSAVPSATTNVVDNAKNSPYQRDGNPRPRTYNASGVQLIKGGSPNGAGFFDSCTTAYTNLVNSPIALVCFFVGCFGLIALHQGAMTPIDTLYNTMLLTANNGTQPYPIRTIASIFTWFFYWFATYDELLLPTMVFAGIYIAKPSTNNAYLCSLLTLVAWLSKMNFLEMLVLGQLALLYTQVRNTSYRLAIMLIGIFCIIIGFVYASDMVGLSGMTAMTAASTLGHPEPVNLAQPVSVIVEAPHSEL